MEWISVEDRLPEEGVVVLVHYEHYVDSLAVIPAKLVRGSWYVQREWHSDTFVDSDDFPQYWMSRPTLPSQ